MFTVSDLVLLMISESATPGRLKLYRNQLKSRTVGTKSMPLSTSLYLLLDTFELSASKVGKARKRTPEKRRRCSKMTCRKPRRLEMNSKLRTETLKQTVVRPLLYAPSAITKIFLLGWPKMDIRSLLIKITEERETFIMFLVFPLMPFPSLENFAFQPLFQ
ncbi:hypothetical protein ACTXT7_015127 [Hymenolepis weldensis]